MPNPRAPLPLAAPLLAFAALLSGCVSTLGTTMNDVPFNEERALYLLDRGRTPNTVTADGMTVLRKALGLHNTRVALAMVDHGLRVNEPDVYQNFPLHYAADFSNAAVAAALIAKGADVNARDAAGATPLLRVGREEAQAALEIGKLLIQKGADVRAVDSRGETALHEAARIKDLGFERLILDAGLDVNARDTQTKETPLSVCAMERWTGRRPETLPAAALLVAQGADINAEDVEGYTPLARALWDGSSTFAAFLRALGAKAGTVTEDQAVKAGIAMDQQKGQHLMEDAAKIAVELSTAAAAVAPPCPEGRAACLQTCCADADRCCIIHSPLSLAGYCSLDGSCP